ncbi:MAG: 50S ribosomal protein L11 methyltransferase [Deltaproteobacteria bacterium]|nr:50S ribosomal protein L11 methyltransferase [Deltaproteobacteria bacterium]
MTVRDLPPPISLSPCWQIVAPGQVPGSGRLHIVIAPGASFGDGTHPTTQLCLQAIAALAPRGRSGWRLLDFGCGNGVLAIGAARLGASVDAIEIDATAIAEAERNARLNAVDDRIRFAHTLDGAVGPFDLVVANILRPVLLEHAVGLVGLLAAGGALLLSGLVATDVPAISARFSPLLDGRRPEVFEQGEWRELVWRA